MACSAKGRTTRSILILLGLLFLAASLHCGDVVLFEEEEEEEETQNSPPSASLLVDPSEVRIGTEVTLDGSGSSDPDSDTLSYHWLFESIPPLAPIDSAQFAEDNIENPQPTFTPLVGGEYRIQLTVDDGEDESEESAQATVTASLFYNNVPTAVIESDEEVRTGSTIDLDGTGSSDPDGDAIRYCWSITEKPEGSEAELSNPTSDTPTFDADLDGDYKVQLLVSDHLSTSDPEPITITADNTFNQEPEANAGVDHKAMVDIAACPAWLDGSESSDPDGDGLTYYWTFSSVPYGSTVTYEDLSPGQDDPTPTFVPDMEGYYKLILTVTDDFVPSTSTSTTTTTTTTTFSPPNTSTTTTIPIIDTTLPTTTTTTVPSLLSRIWSELRSTTTVTETTTTTTTVTSTTTTSTSTITTTTTSTTSTTVWSEDDWDEVIIDALSDYTALACFEGGPVDFTYPVGGISDTCFWDLFESAFPDEFSASADLPPGDPFPTEIVITFADPIGDVTFDPSSDIDSDGNEVILLSSTTEGPYDFEFVYESITITCTVSSVEISGTITPTDEDEADMTVTFQNFEMDEDCYYQPSEDCQVVVSMEGERS